MRCCPRFAVARYCSVVVVVLISASFRRYRPDHIVKACIVTLVLVHLSRALFNFSIHQQTTRRSTCVRTTLYTLCFTTIVHTRWNNQQEQSARGRRSTSLAAAQHLINPARPGSSRSTKIRPATIAAYVSLRSTISATWRVAYICSILPNRSTQPRHRTHHRRRIQISNAYKYG
jgi:hypothetical protein